MIGLGLVLVVISLTTPILSVRRGHTHPAALPPNEDARNHAETD